MSGQAILERLLEGAEVEWVPLEAVTEYEQPTKYLVESENYDDSFVIPVLTAGKTFVLGYTNEATGIYKAATSPVIIFDDFTTANKWVDFDFKAKSSAMKMITSRDDQRFYLKYVYYWINTLPTGLVDGDHKRQWISNFSQKSIPIPCPDDPEKSLAIQTEISRILDRFSELTAELTGELAAELKARKKQYKHYRDQLLTFDDAGVDWKYLADIADIGTGSRNTNEAVPNGRYPFFVRSQEPRSIDQFEFDDTAIITAGDGVGVGKVFHYISGKYALHQRAYRIKVTSDEVNSKYLFHYIRNNFAHYLRQISVHASVTSLRKPMFEKYPVPIPRKEGDQERIVAMLDQFDTLTTALNEDLPREIELRRMQCEYYRNLLLDFPKLASVG